MADKVVQLTDKDGNNIYPICAGVSNTIQSDELADGSVTHAKLGTPVFRSSIAWGSIRKTLLKSPNGLGYGDPAINLADSLDGDYDFLEMTYRDQDGTEWIEKIVPKWKNVSYSVFYVAPAHFHTGAATDATNIYMDTVRFLLSGRTISASQAEEMWLPNGHTSKVYAQNTNNKIVKIVGVKL